MNPAGLAIALSIGVFVGMAACLEVGYRVGRRRSEVQPELAFQGIGAIEASVFALLGLLLAFILAGSTSRPDARRQLIVQEANAIGTAYLRLDLLAANQQPEMRHLFREYLDTRLRVYASLPDLNAADREIARAAQIQQRIWSQAINARRADPTQDVSRVLLPALNEMIDVTTARSIALHTHLPSLIFFLLVSIALLSGFLAGYAMAERKHRSLLHLFLYAAIVSITIYAVVDLDYPRSGLIRLDVADNALIQLRDSIQ
ncbi:MAG: DUF4239 domain-containing protein [Acidobacteriota bacterium]|nr:DUF4239 domain-containing protein [Acidobacteriota bacterium]